MGQKLAARREPTQILAFGLPRDHDASAFYARLRHQAQRGQRSSTRQAIDEILNGDARR